MKSFLVAIDSGLNEAFEKLKRALDGLSEDELHWRPTLESNTIDWMVLHMALVEDGWVNIGLRGLEMIWGRDGWSERLPGGEDVARHGGQTGDEIRSMPAFDVSLVMEYYEAVRAGTREYFANEMREEDLSKGVEETGDPPLTFGWVLGHLLCEEAEHLGQIEYLRGMMRGLGE